jgi:hypothetical protein
MRGPYSNPKKKKKKVDTMASRHHHLKLVKNFLSYLRLLPTTNSTTFSAVLLKFSPRCVENVRNSVLLSPLSWSPPRRHANTLRTRKLMKKYCLTFGFREPYSVLGPYIQRYLDIIFVAGRVGQLLIHNFSHKTVDSDIVRECAQLKLDLLNGLQRTLHSPEIKPSK